MSKDRIEAWLAEKLGFAGTPENTSSKPPGAVLKTPALATPVPFRNRPRTFKDNRRVPKTDSSPKLKVIPLGGMEEVGKNMMVFEYDNDIVIIDMGLMFPEEKMHGIDYVIPDVEYLRGKEKNIRGILITHGHYDHIGAIPHLMPKLGLNIPIFATPLTRALIAKRQEEFTHKLNLKNLDPDKPLQLGKFRAEFFRVNHNIPDCVGIALRSPVGTVIHTGDWKMDHSPINDAPIELNKIARLGQEGVLAAFCDSTNAHKEGYQLSETEIQMSLDQIFIGADGRIITGTFASLLSRIQQIITLSAKHGRKIVVEGRSMRDNIEIAKELRYLKYPKGIFINTKQANSLPDNQVTIMCTGAQGEENAALMRIADKKNPHVKIKSGDTVIFSSSIVPGNENTVALLVDKLYRQGAHVINYKMMDIHAGGHAKAEEAKLLVRLLKPKFFIPIEGNHSLLCMHAQVLISAGFPKERILIPDNGQILEFTKDTGHKTETFVRNNLVAVDGLGVGDVGNVVLQDRQHMAENGIFVIVLTVDKDSGNLKTSPDIISRGFIYMRGAKELVSEARTLVKDTYEKYKDLFPAQLNELKQMVASDTEKFLYKKTEREPMILTVIVKV